MLPSFPKARQAMQKAFNDEFTRVRKETHPVMDRVQIRVMSEGSNMSLRREDGSEQEMDFQVLSVKRSVQPQDATGLSPEDFLELAGGMGKEVADQMFDQLMSVLSDATDATGNVTESRGKGITFEAFLETCDKIYTDFDDENEFRERTLLISPVAAEQWKIDAPQWLTDPEKVAALERVKIKKLKEYHEREARRTMVD